VSDYKPAHACHSLSCAQTNPHPCHDDNADWYVCRSESTIADLRGRLQAAEERAERIRRETLEQARVAAVSAVCGEGAQCGDVLCPGIEVSERIRALATEKRDE
jgi:ferredoxin-NADP reductase